MSELIHFNLTEKQILQEFLIGLAKCAIITQNTNEGIWVVDNDHKTVFVNERMIEIIGYNSSELLGTTIFEYMDEEGEKIARSYISKQDLSRQKEYKLITKNNEAIWVNLNSNIIAKDNVKGGAIAFISDITDLKKQQLHILREHQRYRSLFENSPVPTWDEDFSLIKKRIDELKLQGVKDFNEFFNNNLDEVDRCAQLLIVNDVNQAVVDLNETTSKEELIDGFRLLVNSKSTEYAIRQMVAIAEGDLECEFDAELKTFKGNLRHVNFKWAVVKGYEDNYGKVYLTTSDVTARIIAENETLKVANREKELLLMEIHHRVKNNLQIMSSLLNLQKNTSEDKATQELFDLSLHRIKAMAIVHDLLYKTKDFSKINFRDYMNALIAPLIASTHDGINNIDVEIKAPDCFFNINTAIPIGLLTNEIITNSIKHGFESSQKRKIYVFLSSIANDEYTLSIGDNGKGYPKEINFENTDTLGLQLIMSLTDQLGGVITRSFIEAGTHYKIKFKEVR